MKGQALLFATEETIKIDEAAKSNKKSNEGLDQTLNNTITGPNDSNSAQDNHLIQYLREKVNPNNPIF